MPELSLQAPLPTLSKRMRQAWLKALAEDHMPTTCTTYRFSLRRFLRWLYAQKIPPQEVTRQDLIRWRDERLAHGVAANSIEIDLAAVRHFFSWAQDQGLPIENPARDVHVRGRRGMARRHKRNTLSDDQVEQLLHTCDRRSHVGQRDHALLCLMVYCAVRSIEIQRAEVGDLERRDGRLLLWVWGKGHAGPDDFVVLPAPAEAALQEWLDQRQGKGGPLFCGLGTSHGRRLSLRQIRKIVLGRLRRCGLNDPHTSTHSLRHTAITKAIDAQATPLEVQAMARHADVRTTLGYYHQKDRLEHPAEDRIVYGDRKNGA